MTDTTLDQLKQHLTALRDLQAQCQMRHYPYTGLEDFILKHATPAVCTQLVDDDLRGEPKQCFYNAQMLAINDPTLTYVEGYAQSVIPIHHGWCRDADGCVIDPTWKDPEGKLYFGVGFRTEYVRQQILDTGFAGSLILNDRDQFKLLRGLTPLTESLA